jgi:predicted DNA-binding ribbon-helix-helix protein
MKTYEQAAHDVAVAIQKFAEKPETLDNFESYLRYNFEAWLKNHASTPEDFAAEMTYFSGLEI